MKFLRAAAVSAACLMLSAGFASAQEEQNYIFSEYYVCDQNREAFADTIVEHVFSSVYDKHVEFGDLTGWGWLAHNAGGEWRRVLFYTANDLNKLLETRGKMIEEFQANMADEGREFTSICGDHDDLIWAREAGPTTEQLLANLGTAVYSTYYVCDTSRQERADEIVRQLFTPAINALMGEGGPLKGWGWYSHVIGGRFRRLMTHSGMSHASLIDAVNRYNEAAGSRNEALATEFSQICNAHVDYLWDRVLPAEDEAGN